MTLKELLTAYPLLGDLEVVQYSNTVTHRMDFDAKTGLYTNPELRSVRLLLEKEVTSG